MLLQYILLQDILLQYAPVGVKKTNLDGRIEATSLALQKLLYRPKAFDKVFLVDSKAAIQPVSSNSQAKLKKINDIKQPLKPTGTQ